LGAWIRLEATPRNQIVCGDNRRNFCTPTLTRPGVQLPFSLEFRGRNYRLSPEQDVKYRKFCTAAGPGKLETQRDYVKREIVDSNWLVTTATAQMPCVNRQKDRFRSLWDQFAKPGMRKWIQFFFSTADESLDLPITDGFRIRRDLMSPYVTRMECSRLVAGARRKQSHLAGDDKIRQFLLSNAPLFSLLLHSAQEFMLHPIHPRSQASRRARRLKCFANTGVKSLQNAICRAHEIRE